MWEQIVEVIGGVDAAACRTKISKEKTKAGQLLYSPVAMNPCYAALLRTHGWMPSVTRHYVTANQDLIRKTLLLPQEQQRQLIIEAGLNPILSYNQTDFVRDRIAIEIQFGSTPLWPTTCS